MTSINFTVEDKPGPQGSKRHVGNGRMIESSKTVKPWRDAVRLAAIEAKQTDLPFPHRIPVGLQIIFYHRRPKSHYRTGKNAHLLRDDAPTYVTTKPDVSKLVRSTEDAITASGIWADDSQVVRLTIWQKYAAGFEGAHITVWEIKE